MTTGKKHLSLRRKKSNSSMATSIEKKEVSTHEKVNISSDKALADFIAGRNNKSLKDLKGKISFRDDYDYKSMRR